MPKELDIFSYKPEILTALTFEEIDDFRSKRREELGDKLKRAADELARDVSPSWTFSKRLDSDGEMELSADLGAGEAYSFSLGKRRLTGVATKAQSLDFFLKFLAPLFVQMLPEIPRENINFLGIVFRFSLIVSEDTTKAQVMNSWPFSGKLDQLVDCNSLESIEASSATFVYKGNAEFTHYLSATARLTGRNRISFAMDTRKETTSKIPSQSEICAFYNKGKDYASSLIKGPIALIFRKSKPEE